MFPFDEIYRLLYYNVWYFIKAYYIGLIYLLKEWYRRIFFKQKKLCFAGLTDRYKYAVLTGATQGIGLEVAEQLLELGITVTIGALMSGEGCLNFENSLRTKFPDTKVTVWPINLKSMRSVKSFAERYLRTSLPLHILVNNAGVMYVPYEETIDCFEHHMSVNYFGHCLLTQILLPRLIESGQRGSCSRIINTSSSTHFVGDINFEDLQSRKHYSPTFCYLQSKLAVVLFTISLQKYLQQLHCNVTANSLHPGVVYTNLYKHVFWAPYIGPYLFKAYTILDIPSISIQTKTNTRNAKEGSQTIMYCSLSPELEGIGGKYFEECEIVQASSTALDELYQKKLWQVTWKKLDRWVNETTDIYF